MPTDRKELENIAADILRMLAGTLPAGVGLSIFTFHYGHGGHIAYASTAKRADMIKSLRELLGNLEKER